MNDEQDLLEQPLGFPEIPFEVGPRCGGCHEAFAGGDVLILSRVWFPDHPRDGNPHPIEVGQVINRDATYHEACLPEDDDGVFMRAIAA